MKLIAIEEHFLTSAVKNAWKKTADDDPTNKLHFGEIENRLEDIGNSRLQLMDETGIDVQVLSLTSPSLHNLGSESIGLARQTNDYIAEIVKKTPDRFQGFAALPMFAPKEAAKELERSVKNLGLKGAMLCGRTREKNVDHTDYWELFECAERLGIPLFIHPQIPQKAVRDIYYSGFDEWTDLAFSTFGLGWHYEAGIQFVRLVLAKVFDSFPNLQIILGHWGEVILFYTERLASLNRVTKLQKPFLDYVRQNLYVTPSGMFSQNYLQRSIEIMGTDRILFSSDYPYQYRPGREARNFLEATPLSKVDKEKFAFANWERLISTK
ncbi:amidohydrolase family protein [Cytophagaceae bacterium YF14B1]|uniref:Amidohydrolase family protein n=1 Tax=Xanthocytophaga flava TaxID=3048013 RepID=A0AAE3U5L0_9BACT|nr:amidohydrolase family protein [Xanthocytophaga flavus]MDJ1480899.1 amidohydrolase family protein [Xanthocytophaga flavus]